MPQQVKIEADEFCLFFIEHWSTCSTKSEWASWIQAFGVISAILLPAVLAMIKRYKSKKFSLMVFFEIDHLKSMVLSVEAYLDHLSSNPDTTAKHVLRALEELRDIKEPSNERLSALGYLDPELAQEINSVYLHKNRIVELQVNSIINSSEVIGRNFAALTNKSLAPLIVRLHMLEKAIKNFQSKPFWRFF